MNGAQEVATEIIQETTPIGQNIVYVLYVIYILFFLILFIISNKKYKQMIAPLDSKEFQLKGLICVGCGFVELIKYKYTHFFDRKFRSMLYELYEKEYCEYYMRIYYGQMVTFFMVGLLFTIVLTSTGDYLMGFIITVVLSVILASTVYFGVKKRYESRQYQFAMDLPDVVNKLVILLGAGLNMRAAWEKVATEMDEDTPIYDEMKFILKQINNGVAESDAFENMAQRCNLQQVRRFVSIIVQNIQRGGGDIAKEFDAIGYELWAGRKAVAKVKAAEASTKILFPMMLMLIAVMLIIAGVAAAGMNL